MGSFEIIPDDNFLVVHEEIVDTTSSNKEQGELQQATKALKIVPFFEANDYLNGALYDERNYCWSQTRNEIEIHIRLPNGLNSSKHVSVVITSSKISIKQKLDKDDAAILEGIIVDKFKHTEAMWTISNSGKLTISLDKCKEIWWKKLFDHESEINVNKIDCSRPIDELPEETQSGIERIRWDEEQKLNGNLTSEQVQQHEMLRKAWDVDGSPFKGMPFDPNSVQFANRP